MKYSERVLGAVLGHLAGDALGVPYEFEPAAALPAEISWRGYGTHGQPPGTWSDDGALMLCALESLVERGGFDPGDMGRRFVRWMDEGHMAPGGVVFDYGTTTRLAIDGLRSGISPLEAGPSGESDNGNGSLMRILPVSLWTAGTPLEYQVRMSHDCSKLTHSHPRSQVCCALFSLLVRKLATGTHLDEAWDAASKELAALYASGDEWPHDLLAELQGVLSYEHPSSGGYVVDTLLSSWLALFGGDDYPSSVRAAVRLGGDTDTTACVAGGLAGIMYGAGSIPDEWRDGLRLEPSHRALIDRFARECPAPGTSG